MKNGSYFIPREQIYSFMNPGALNNQEGLWILWETDPAATAPRTAAAARSLRARAPHRHGVHRQHPRAHVRTVVHGRRPQPALSLRRNRGRLFPEPPAQWPGRADGPLQRA